MLASTGSAVARRRLLRHGASAAACSSASIASAAPSSSCSYAASRSLSSTIIGEAGPSRIPDAASRSEDVQSRQMRALHRSAPSARPSASRFGVEARSGSHSTSAASSSQAHTRPATLSPRSITPQESVEDLQAELQENVLPGFPLPDSVAVQAITHESWDYGRSLGGHNRRLSFLGRRALKAFLVMFFHSALASPPPTSSSSASRSASDAIFSPSSEAIDALLHTAALGQGAGASLRLERVMRWTPALLPPAPSSGPGSDAAPADGPASSASGSGSSGASGGNAARESGLYKIRGVCLEALVGAIYHQHGAHMAQLFFTSQVLPVLRVYGAGSATGISAWPREVPEWVRERALAMANDATAQLNDEIAKRTGASGLSSGSGSQMGRAAAEGGSARPAGRASAAASIDTSIGDAQYGLGESRAAALA